MAGNWTDRGRRLKKIPLTRGLFAIVSDCDFKRLSSGYSWQADPRPHGNFYAKRVVGGLKKKDGTYTKRVSQYMHREVFGKQKRHVDHRDGNGLHNWRRNLRKSSRTQNSWNSKTRGGKLSGFKGVYRSDTPSEKWYSKIRLNKKNIHLGSFSSAIMAAKAYDVAALRLFGRFANLNFGGRK
jgi:hypothetical protein